MPRIYIFAILCVCVCQNTRAQVWQPISSVKSGQPSATKNPLQQHRRRQAAEIRRQKQSTLHQQKPRQESNRAISEELRRENAKAIQYQFPSSMHLAGAKKYNEAFEQLKEMLKDENELSLKDAVFLTEKAFYGDKLERTWYEEEINRSVEIIKNEVKARGYKSDNELAKKMILHQFFSDTIVVKDSEGKVLYRTDPYQYDFDDIYGKKDRTKMFVTKLMFTGSGQCHSMPLLYLILAEALGIEAYLALSPEHSYIKLKDDKGSWFNLELTNGAYSTDSWVLSSGYVKAEAIQNGLYMKALSKKETIAMSLVDLGMEYVHKYGFDEFVLQCAEKALEYAPNNISALQLRANYHTFLFKHVAQQMGFPPPASLPNYPKLYAMYQQFHSLYKEIDDLGYEYMPPIAYKKWLESLNNNNLQTKLLRP